MIFFDIPELEEKRRSSLFHQIRFINAGLMSFQKVWIFQKYIISTFITFFSVFRFLSIFLLYPSISTMSFLPSAVICFCQMKFVWGQLSTRPEHWLCRSNAWLRKILRVGLGTNLYCWHANPQNTIFLILWNSHFYGTRKFVCEDY